MHAKVMTPIRDHKTKIEAETWKSGVISAVNRIDQIYEIFWRQYLNQRPIVLDKWSLKTRAANYAG
jgi:hypothetical protein